MDSIFWDVVIFLFLFGGSAAGFIQHLQSRRHRFKLEMAKQRTRQEQAKADALKEHNRKASLDLRAAELEIEKFDRHIPGLPTPRLPSGTEPEDMSP